MRVTYVCLLFVLALANDVQSARILGLFPHTGKSHHMVFEPLIRTLAERGHHVTVASFFPMKYPPANYTEVSFEGISKIGLETIDLEIFENAPSVLNIPVIGNVIQSYFNFNSLADMAINFCKKAVDWPPLIDALNKKYDVVIVENFNSDCMLGLLDAYNIKTPVIALLSTTLLPWSSERMSVMDNPAFIPILSTTLQHPMSLLGRIENTITSVVTKLWFRHSVQIKEQEIIEKRYGYIEDLGYLSKNMSLMLVNTHHSLNGRKLLPPGVVEVGGMHLHKTKQNIPQHIEKFVNESEHGVVLCSFGSLIKTSSMPKYKEEILIKSLSKLKQRVIWKYENSADEGDVTGNIMRVKWLPQYELLQHKNVVAFVAHGGLLGMTEAISAGKPLVVIPFFGDQPTNAAAAQAAGIAKIITWAELTEESLDAALQIVLGAETRTKASLLSQIWNDRQSSPLETAVYWTERVIRWGHAAPLHSVAREMPFYQTMLLDVAAVFLTTIILLLVAVWLILRKILCLFVKVSKKKVE